MTDKSLRATARPRAGKTLAAGKRAIANEKAGLKRPKAAPLSAEAEETLNAIRAGQIDALVIQDAGSHKVYALRSFAEIRQAKVELRNAGTERKRTNAQLQALLQERERLFQDLHDGCIQSIYAVGLTLEAAMRLGDAQPNKVGPMLGDSIASLNLVIQELRSFMSGHQRQMGTGQNLRSEIEKAIRAAGNRGVEFTVEIDPATLSSLTDEQSLQLLQIARECISNAARHSGARTGCIALHEQDGAVHFEISDDGAGFIPAQSKQAGFGLHHIDARARKIGGSARIISAPNQGTRIIVRIGKCAAARRRLQT